MNSLNHKRSVPLLIGYIIKFSVLDLAKTIGLSCNETNCWAKQDKLVGQTRKVILKENFLYTLSEKENFNTFKLCHMAKICMPLKAQSIFHKKILNIF